MQDPKDEPIVIEMYEHAYPDLSYSTIIQLIDLEFNEALSRILTFKKAVDNGFRPEASAKVIEQLNRLDWAVLFTQNSEEASNG